MNAELIIKALTALEPDEETQIGRLHVRRWASGTGWTAGSLDGQNVRGSSSLPVVVSMIERGLAP